MLLRSAEDPVSWDVAGHGRLRSTVLAAVGATLLAVAQEGVLAQSVLREVLLPPTARGLAELAFENGHAVGIRRAALRNPGPDDDGVVVLDRGGAEVLRPRVSAAFVSAKGLNIRDAAMGARGLWVSVDEEGASGHRSFLLHYGLRSSDASLVVDISPIVCLEIAVDHEDNVWCLGGNPAASAPQSDAWTLLQKFSAKGNLLGSMLPRAQVPAAAPRFPFFDTRSGATTMTTNGGVVSVWLAPLELALQVDRSGRLARIARAGTHGRARGVVVLEDGRVVLDSVAQDGRLRLAVLRNDGSWNAPESEIDADLGSPHWRVVGADGNAVVMWSRTTGRLQWRQSPNGAGRTAR